MLLNGDLPTEDFHLISSCPCWAYTRPGSTQPSAAGLATLAAAGVVSFLKAGIIKIQAQSFWKIRF